MIEEIPKSSLVAAVVFTIMLVIALIYNCILLSISYFNDEFTGFNYQKLWDKVRGKK